MCTEKMGGGYGTRLTHTPCCASEPASQLAAARAAAPPAAAVTAVLAASASASAAAASASMRANCHGHAALYKKGRWSKRLSSGEYASAWYAGGSTVALWRLAA